MKRILSVQLALATACSAATTVFTDEASFLSAVPDSLLESFESHPTSPSLNVSSVSTAFGSVGVSIVNSMGVFDMVTGGGGMPTDGVKWLTHSSSSGSAPVVFNFDTPVRAFALYIMDSLEGASGSLTYANNVGDSGVLATARQDNGNVKFFGILNTSSSFTTLTINDTSVDAGIAFDEIRFAPVPEPSTSFLLAAAGLLAGVARQRNARR